MPINRKNPFLLEVAKGNIEAHSHVFKFARSSTIEATESVIWDGGGSYTFLTAAEKMVVVSTDAGDNAVGAGARTMIIYGLDANYEEIYEVVALDGLTPVTTTLEFLRVYRAFVITSGSGAVIDNANIGDITITSQTTTTLQAKVLAGNGQTLMAVYTIPKNKTAYVYDLSFSVGQGKQALIKIKTRNGPTSDYAFTTKYTLELYETPLFTPRTLPFEVPEKTDTAFTAITTSGTIAVSCSFDLILANNS